MTHRFKTLLLAAALAGGTVQSSSAAFVKHKTETVTATGAAAATTSVMGEATEAASATPSLHATKAVQKKRGVLARIGAWYAKQMAGDNQVVALILSIFLGGLGIDRFYLGYTGIGILKLLTGGVFGILYLIDIVRIATGDLKPKGGSYSETL